MPFSNLVSMESTVEHSLSTVVIDESKPYVYISLGLYFGGVDLSLTTNAIRKVGKPSDTFMAGKT